jgi:hypothetical protein
MTTAGGRNFSKFTVRICFRVGLLESISITKLVCPTGTDVTGGSGISACCDTLTLEVFASLSLVSISLCALRFGLGLREELGVFFRRLFSFLDFFDLCFRGDADRFSSRPFLSLSYEEWREDGERDDRRDLDRERLLERVERELCDRLLDRLPYPLRLLSFLCCCRLMSMPCF